MKLNRYIKPIAYSILALSVSAVALNSALASQYNNGFTDEIPTRERRVRTQYYHKAPNTFWGETSPYAGEIDTRVQVGQNRLSHSQIEAKPQQAAAPVPCASGHVDNSIFPGGGCGTTMLEATKDQDNSMIPGQGCGGQGKSCEKIVPVSASPCTLNPKTCKARKARVKALDPNTIRYNFIQNYTLKPRHDVYTSIHDKCGKYAPIQLEWVDFRLNEEDINGSLAQKLGNYRFRIFGCRRFTKEALLNQGRLMEQNMRLINVFDNTLKDCFNIVKIPDDICVEDNPSPLPDYLITAEITNYFMNICDKYNWDESAMENRRIGSSEITVRWKITDINRTHVYWSGETDGYGNLTRGEENGEVILVERAFADAVNNLRNHPGFLKQLSRRVPKAEKESQREIYIDNERKNNPAKCQFTDHTNVVTKYVYTPENNVTQEDLQQVQTQTRQAQAQTTTETITEQVQGPTGPAIQIKQRINNNVKNQYFGGEQIPLTKEPSTTTIQTTTTITTDGNAPTTTTQISEQPTTSSITTTITTDGNAPTTTTQISEQPTTSSITTTIDSTSSTPAENITATVAAATPQDDQIIISNLNIEEAGTTSQMPEESIQSSEILLSKEAAPEPFDPTMNPKPSEKRYAGKAEEEPQEESSTLKNILAAPLAPVAAVASLLPEPPKECHNMTLFGPDCDCDNKTHRGCEDNRLTDICEDNKTLRGCEDNKLTEECDECEGLFSDCNQCKIKEANIEEDGGVKSIGSISKESWIAVPTDDKSAIEAQNMLCIVERAPYQTPMSPEDVYKIRASVISITNAEGKQGAGLIVSEQFVLTSADLISPNTNNYKLRTINGGEFTGRAVRINPNKDTALLYLDKETEYTPLSLNLSLPAISQKTYLTLGILDFDTGEGYLEDAGKITGYRYSEQKGTEIIVDTYVQNVTLGGALIDKNGTITGLAHSGNDNQENTDFFLPISSALKSLGLEICGKQIQDLPAKNETISEAILFNTGSKEPLPMDKSERK